MHSNAFLSRGRCHDAQPAILHIAQLADANREHWAAADVLKARGLVQRTLQGKRMRLASDVRELVVLSELQAGRADKASTFGKTSQICDRHTAMGMVEGELAALQAACRLSHHTPMTLFLCFDAAAIGKPHRDLPCIRQSCRRTDTNVVLPMKETCLFRRPPPSRPMRHGASHVLDSGRGYETNPDFVLGGFGLP